LSKKERSTHRLILTTMFTLAEAAGQIRDRKLSSLELTRACLDRIAKLDPQLNAFITVTEDLAWQQARQADAEVASGHWRGPLHGIPIAFKDLIDVAGVKTTAGSNQFLNRVATEDAAIVKLLKAAGAVIVGKNNLQEFAFGGSGIISAFGPTRNPWDLSRISGGSSSGSAAAVAGGMCMAALGTDTAGSVRDPAALCNLIGYRPSAGVWSMDGIIPLRKSFDTVGLLTRTAEDARLMFDLLTRDSAHTELTPIDHVRAGVAREGFFDNLEPEVAKCIEEALRVIGSLVASISEVRIEVGAQWTNFDFEILEHHSQMLADSPQLYQTGTLTRLKACSAIPSAESQQAQRELAAKRIAGETIFNSVDVVLTPTCRVTAPKVSHLLALSDKDLRAYEVQKLLGNTAPFSLLFWPSVSMPCGFTDEGLPVGLQISVRPGADALALRVARDYQQATGSHKQTPAIVT
jgi:aspartyl-tRNA(Asn)/glutamyl-tRNA(Gln) amidotransferase subunit A